MTDIDAMGEAGVVHVLAFALNVEGMETVAKSFPRANLDLRTCGAPETPFAWQYPHFDLLKDGDFPFDSSEGFTPLMLAILASSPPDVLLRMVRLGCGVECVTVRHRWTPLMIACALGSMDLVAVLVRDLRVNVFKRDVFGWTALHILCATTMHVEFPFFPEEAFAVRDNYGLTPIDIAAAAGAFGSPMDVPQLEIAAPVPRSDRAASEKVAERKRAGVDAVMREHEFVNSLPVTNLVFFMVQRAFSWNLEANLLSLARHLDSWCFQSPDDGSTPLMIATRRIFLSLFAAILSTSSGLASIDLPDAHGRTALHWACEAREEVLIDSLLASGASTSVRDPEGSTPALYFLQSTNGTPLSNVNVRAAAASLASHSKIRVFRFCQSLWRIRRVILPTPKRARRRCWWRLICGTKRPAGRCWSTLAELRQ